jgi:small subunit ribosomal protein S6e
MSEKVIKVNISDPETGKTYKLELNELGFLLGKKIGYEFDGSLLKEELKGYKLKIKGGSDNAGFPMHPGVHGVGRKQLLLSDGPGYRPRHHERYHGIRRKKTVHGNTIDDLIVQVNCVVMEKGEKPLEEIFKKEENKEEGDAQ